MNLTTILLMLIFIIPIILGVVFYRFSKKLSVAFISIPFIFMLIVVGWWFYEANHRFTGSTDLTNEQIDDLELHVTVDETFKDNHGEFEESDDAKYREYLEFDTFAVGTDFKNNKVVYVQTDQPGVTTTKYIEIGDSEQEVIEQYGEKYYKSSEMGQGSTINYVDRDAGIHLQFWLEDGHVDQISIYSM